MAIATPRQRRSQSSRARSATSRLRVHVTAGWRPGADGRPEAAFWTVGEVADRIPGSDLEAVLMYGRRRDRRPRLKAASFLERCSLLVPVVASRSLEPGDYQVRVRSQTPSGVETLTMPVTLHPQRLARDHPARCSCGAGR